VLQQRYSLRSEVVKRRSWRCKDPVYGWLETFEAEVGMLEAPELFGLLVEMAADDNYSDYQGDRDLEKALRVDRKEIEKQAKAELAGGKTGHTNPTRKRGKQRQLHT